VSKLADLLKVAGNPPAFFVINKAPTQGSEGANAAEFIEKQGFTVSPCHYPLRAAHRHASNVGKVAVEYEADSKAAQETLQLYMYTMKFINTQRKTHAQSRIRSRKGLNCKFPAHVATGNSAVPRPHTARTAVASSRSGRVLVAGHLCPRGSNRAKSYSGGGAYDCTGSIGRWELTQCFAKRRKPEIAEFTAGN